MKSILISKFALKKMEQLTAKYPKLENGGFIYGRMNPQWLQIWDVSDAGENAKRSYSGIEFEKKHLTKYTEEKVNNEQFVVGTWHSHPKGASLIPSNIDYITMKNITKYYDYNYYPIFIITKIQNDKLLFSIYRINEENGISEIKEYELFESED